MVATPISQVAANNTLAESEVRQLCDDAGLPITRSGSDCTIDSDAFAALRKLKTKFDSQIEGERRRTSTAKADAEKAKNDLDAVRRTFSIKPYWGGDKLLNIIIALAAVAAAGVAACQLRTATAELRANNNYKAQSDILESLNRVSEALNRPLDAASAADDDRVTDAVLALDARMEAINDLHDNGGISDEAWAAIKRRICPSVVSEKNSAKRSKLLEKTAKMCANIKP